jgi:hypothetical protein
MPIGLPESGLPLASVLGNLNLAGSVPGGHGLPMLQRLFVPADVKSLVKADAGYLIRLAVWVAPF